MYEWPIDYYCSCAIAVISAVAQWMDCALPECSSRIGILALMTQGTRYQNGSNKYYVLTQLVQLSPMRSPILQFYPPNPPLTGGIQCTVSGSCGLSDAFYLVPMSRSPLVPSSPCSLIPLPVSQSWCGCNAATGCAVGANGATCNGQTIVAEYKAAGNNFSQSTYLLPKEVSVLAC